MKVCVVGLGQVGLPVALYVKDKGVDVVGYDININALSAALEKRVPVYQEWEEVPTCDAYMICVGTFVEENKPGLSPLYDVCTRIKRMMTDNTLVSIESTVPVGTCRTLFDSVFESRGMLIHVPHRYWVGDPENHGVRQMRVMGAINGKSMAAGRSFYSRVLDIPLHTVPSIEVAEMCKITENAYRYLQIAFSEELKMLCEDNRLDFNVLRNACNTKWNVEILEARDGIGGHCLPKDVQYFTLLSKQSMIARTAIEADRRYKAWLDTRKIGSVSPRNQSQVATK
jgi:nucleotide sugar dehydrogenase